MQAPIQKIKNGRCRKTPKGLPMAERDKMWGLSGIKDSYHLNNGGSTGLLTGSDVKSSMVVSAIEVCAHRITSFLSFRRPDRSTRHADIGSAAKQYMLPHLRRPPAHRSS